MPEAWHLQLDSDIPDLLSEFDKMKSAELEFACFHWITLLCEADCMDDDIMAQQAVILMHP